MAITLFSTNKPFVRRKLEEKLICLKVINKYISNATINVIH